jgi:hypothetical protein
MEQLQLNQISGYFDFGLKVWNEGFSDTNILTVDGYYTIDKINKIWLSFIEKNGGQSIDDCKPILYPLLDILKEREIEGKQIVPLIELAKIAYPKNRPLSDFSICNGYVKLDNWNIGGYSFHFDKKEISFDCRVDFNGHTWRNNCYVPNQLKLLQKLYEWHFDIHGLIEKGLAIDINTLNLK